MKKSIIRSSWLAKGGYRLDCSPYLGGALETEMLLDELSVRKDLLSAVTSDIFNGPKFSRTYVEDPKNGVPFLGGSSLQQSDFINLPLLSNERAHSKQLRHLEIKRGMTLISCTGTIGKLAYAREEMEGMWSSQHIMKVVPDEAKILPGYLYAYLSSKFGIPLIIAGTYGSIIQSIEPHHIAGLPVPRFGKALEQKIHNLIDEAGKLRSEASSEITNSTEFLRKKLNLPFLNNKDVRGFGVNVINSSNLNSRLDATYHSHAAMQACAALERCSVPVKSLSSVTARLFKPPMFKRLWVNKPKEGIQFISGIDAYNYEADVKRYVSHRTPKLEEFIVKEGWIIFQAAGQIYGLFGRPLLTVGWLNGLFVADDMYRIVPNNMTDGGYLTAFFRTDVGEVLIKRQSTGNSIPRVWDPQMNQIRVPWPSDKVREEIGLSVIDAHRKIERALKNDHRAIQLIEAAIENRL